MRATLLASLAIAAGLLSGPAAAYTLNVPGDANIFGAGHAVPPDPAGGGTGTLPPFVSFAAGPGQVLRFSSVTGCVTMTTAFGTCNGGDGSTTIAIPTGITSYGGLSGISHDSNAFLVGAFLDDTEPVDPAPLALDFRTTSLGVDFTVLAPELNQTFFVGDGLTGTGTGLVQDFLVPATATRFFLGYPDGQGYAGPPGAYGDNGGFLDAAFDITGGCTAVVTTPPRDVAACAGDVVRLDASGMTVTNCAGAVLYEWTDGASVVGTAPQLDVAPATTTTYVATVSCSADPACAASAPATVTVERPPDFVMASARDLADCNLGVEVTWDAATFHGPGGGGTYSIYRSEIDCADAVVHPPVATGLTGSPWADVATAASGRYAYVVEAEDASVVGPCPLRGADHGGAATRLCIPPVTDVSVATAPAVVCAPLRASHAGDAVTFTWTAARPLLGGEHFHLLRGVDVPTAAFALVTPEGFTGLAFTHEDPWFLVQFFDLRVANACETQSANEYPPPGLGEWSRPCP